MDFQPLFYADRLHVVNPAGDVGVCTLWSQVEQARKVLDQLEIDLSPETSRVAVIANLYGNGLPHMLRNLLWNPQLRHLVILGQDLSGSREELVNFFKSGLEEVEYLGSAAHQIVGTMRIIDGEVTPAHFANDMQIVAFGKISEADTHSGLTAYFRDLPPQQECSLERVNIAIPEATVQRFPSEPRNHNILRASPLDAWEELIFRLVRFGYRNKLKKGERIELQNVKVVIQNPVEEPEEFLETFGFSAHHFEKYQQDILQAEKAPDISYTYGNRLRGYFRHEGEVVDSLAVVIKRLQDDPETRHAYVTLWDNHRDLPVGHSCPCLSTLFFRLFEGRLTLTATFRSHNAMDAWLENVYGLISIQRYVAEHVGMTPGPITVISHSISIDANSLDKAKKVAESKKTDDVVDRATGKRDLRHDAHGYFTVTTDPESQELIVQHSFNGMVINEYRGKTSEAVERQLARDDALSEISHALYLGRELTRQEMAMKAGKSKRTSKSPDVADAEPEEATAAAGASC
jgi:thymidylate synthase